MDHAVPELPPAEIVLRVGPVSLEVGLLPAAETPLAVGPVGVGLPLLPPAEIALGTGPYKEPAPTVVPMLESVHFSFAGANAGFTLVYWTPAGYMQFKAADLSGGADKLTQVSTLDVQAPNLYATGLTVGHVYRAYWKLNCEPDVPGWDDTAWQDMSLQWTQPAKGTPITGDWIGS